MQAIKLFVIEDEPAIRDVIRYSLPRDEFIMSEAATAIEAQKFLADNIPNIIVLDWMLPGKSGIEFMKWLRKESTLQDIPIIMLTARAEDENKIRGLELGADDYVTKPFSPKELIARIKTILRRGRIFNKDNILTIADLHINKDTHTVGVNQKILNLRPIEYRLLLFFVTHPHKIYSREQLIQFIWGRSVYIDDRTVDVNIRRLRDKLRSFNYHRWIKTVRGSGYQLIPD